MTNKEARKVLQEVWRNERTDYKSVEVKEAIDRAIRALEERPQGEWAKGFHEGFNAGTRLAEAFEERPKGEWVNNECPFCGRYENYPENFCATCGADMRGEKK